jgi:hypothetical protein
MIGLGDICGESENDCNTFTCGIIDTDNGMGVCSAGSE